MELNDLTIVEAHRLLKNKEITSRELTQAVLDRIAAIEGRIDASLAF
jgi:aspartyl-tRNA(Asn)/glutamyl-tRNA(Gln) amidotransferase subunit A